MIVLLGCVLPSFVEPTCDPRVLAEGEVRARQLLCTDEVPDSGDGRVGDWVIENAVTRFVFRGGYSALYRDEPGGTLIDALWGEQVDVLAELRVEGERSSPVAENGDGQAHLHMGEATWTLGADDPVLWLDQPRAASVLGVESAARTGGAWLGFFGTDLVGDETVEVQGDLSWVTADPEAWTALRWGSAEPVAASVEADDVEITLDGQTVMVLPVDDGVVTGWAPTGATLTGQREGCTYSGLTLLGCATMTLRVGDELGADVPSVATVGEQAWALPPGGGQVRAGEQGGSLMLDAGPAFSAVTLPYVPGSTVTQPLHRQMAEDPALLMALHGPVWPDPLALQSAAEVVTEHGGLAPYLLVWAQDEVPSSGGSMRPAAVRSNSVGGGSVLSWPWTANGKRPAHGVPPGGLSALDLLAVTISNSSLRRTIVDAAWVDEALSLAPTWQWLDRPMALWMPDPSALDSLLMLLDGSIFVAPVGPQTWVDVVDTSGVGVEAGLLSRASTAGNGPRIHVTEAGEGLEARGWDIRVEAPLRQAISSVEVWTPTGMEALEVQPLGEPFGGVTAQVWLPTGLPWFVVRATGRDGAWAVRVED